MAEGFKTENLRIILDTPLGPDKFFLRNFTGTEGLSRLFRLDLDLLTADKALDMESILGKSVTLKVMLASGQRCFFNGIVSRMRQIGTSVTFANFEAEVVPALWLLSLNTDSRIFQAMTVPDIIHKVLKDSGVDIAVEDKLEDNYVEWEYCVQYQESDFAFISRLMEQEGIFYFFKHTDGGHTLVLGDKSSHHEECPMECDFELLLDGSGRSERDYVTRFNLERSIRAGVYCCTDYNFQTPTVDLLVKQSGKDKAEVYEYPGEYEARDDGDRQARTRLEEMEWQRHTATGTGECRPFRSGHTFNLTVPGGGSNEGKYLLLNVDHHATQAGEMGSETGGGAEGLAYTVGFTAFPADVPFRPPRITPRPGIFGTQTAVVVGKAGEEIWTDKYGRVKVQFFWDRLGKRDENSSCWIRCAHNVAGKTWGQIFIPRIGQEVLVTFIDGDPDRPIIIGSVYNDEQMPPYDLPTDQTKSTIKSRSSKGGDPPNFNEFRFEDKKGKEEIYIHAERNQKGIVEYDQSLEVGNDRRETIGNDRSLTVKGHKSEKVEKNKSIKIGGNHGETIDGEMSLSVKKSRTMMVSEDLGEEVAGAMKLSVGKTRNMNIAGDLTETIDGKMTLTVAKDRRTTIDGGLRIDVAKDMDVGVDGAKGEEVAKEWTLKAKSVSVEANDSITLQTGSASMEMKKNGDITITGKKITIKGSADVVIKGSKVAMN